MPSKSAIHPAIHIIFETTSAKQIQHIRLLSSDRFSMEIMGESAKHLRPLIQQWVESYLQGQKEPIPLPLAWPTVTPFQQKVYQALQEIPFGQSLAYHAVATVVGHSGAARAVGQTCGRNSFPLVIPCHRVIASQGNIGGFMRSACRFNEIKQRLLAFEAG